MARFTFRQLCEAAERVPYLYHVTFSENVPSIFSKGIRQFETSNWVQAGSGKRYNEDAGIFAFEHPEDAIRWALKMEWEFKNPDISIVRFKNSEDWEQDPSGDPSLMGKGRSMKSYRNVPSEDLVDVFNLRAFGKPGEKGISYNEWVSEIIQAMETE